MTDVTRRDVLQRGIGGALALGGAAMLDACGGASKTSQTGPSTNAAGEQKPIRGGTLTVSVMGGASSETLDPSKGAQVPDLIRAIQLYDPLFIANGSLQIEGRLATSAESNKDATVWVLHLRDGVTWHDGKPFDADDVVYSFRAWSSPQHFGNPILAGLVDFKHVRKLSRLKVEVPLLMPVASFTSLFTQPYNMVMQDGATAASYKRHPVGTGPFMYQSFVPGKQSVFVRNPRYWEPGDKPYVDRLVILSSFTDEGARLNALLSGQTNALASMTPSHWKAQQSAGQVTLLRSAAPWGQEICMRVDKAPFNDVRVRQAMKHIIDRQAIVDAGFQGLANVGNDLFGGAKQYRAKHFLDLPPHPHDPEKAKALLKAAGQENLSFTLPIAPALPGYVEAGTLFAEQAKAAGVNVKLEQVSVGQYFAYPQYPNRTIQVSSTLVYADLTPLYRAFFGSGSFVDETHWGTPARDAQLNKAIAATDEQQAADLWREIQQTQYDQGGEIVFAQADYLDAVAKNVHGLTAGPVLPFNGCRFLDGWLT